MDFDGTITAHDFYKLVVGSLLTPSDIAPWQEYRDGKITHLAALQQIFAKIRASESELDNLALAMQPDPRLGSAVACLREAGWEIVVRFRRMRLVHPPCAGRGRGQSSCLRKSHKP